MRNSRFRLSTRHKCIGGFVALLVIILIRDHCRGVLLTRPKPHANLSTSLAYVHHSSKGYRLSYEERDSVGIARFASVCNSIDRSWLFTEVLEWRHLHVMIDGKPVTGRELDTWRGPAATFFQRFDILLGEKDGTRMLILGYPGEWLGLFMCAASIVLIPAFILQVLSAFLRELESHPPESSRERRLRRGLCPRCKYDLRGLPQCRCPECGERWLPCELTRACNALQQVETTDQHG